MVIGIAELSQLLSAEAAAEEGRCSRPGDGNIELLDKAVKGWLQRVAIAIEQLELEEVLACFQRLEPKRLGSIEHHTAAIKAQPEPPLLIAIAQVLQGRIEQKPVDGHSGASGQLLRCHRHQLRGV